MTLILIIFYRFKSYNNGSSVESYFQNPNYSMNVEAQNKLRPRLVEIEKSSSVSCYKKNSYHKELNKYFLHNVILSYKVLTTYNSRKISKNN